MRTATICGMILCAAILTATLSPLHSQKKNESFLIMNAALADGTVVPRLPIRIDRTYDSLQRNITSRRFRRDF